MVYFNIMLHIKFVTKLLLLQTTEKPNKTYTQNKHQEKQTNKNKTPAFHYLERRAKVTPLCMLHEFLSS